VTAGTAYPDRVPLVALIVVLMAPLLAAALIPVSLVLRYRAGTARRQARGWVATINIVAAAVSAALLLLFAMVTSVWVPGALAGALAGFITGGVLGVIGLLISRWERTPLGLYYTPSRWLILGITLLVFARLAWGIWRGWHAWWAAAGDTSWLATAGIPGSLAAAGIFLGYYLAYWSGIRRAAARHERSRAPLTIDVRPSQ
jgi:hypothetical protein